MHWACDTVTFTKLCFSSFCDAFPSLQCSSSFSLLRAPRFSLLFSRWSRLNPLQGLSLDWLSGTVHFWSWWTLLFWQCVVGQCLAACRSSVWLYFYFFFKLADNDIISPKLFIPVSHSSLVVKSKVFRFTKKRTWVVAGKFTKSIVHSEQNKRHFQIRCTW